MSARDVNDIYRTLERSLPRVTISGQTYFVAEWDLLLDADRLLAYAADQAERESGASPSVEHDRLLGRLDESGRRIRWAPGLELTYTVQRDTFAADIEYQIVVRNMLAATDAWSAVCGVSFRHLVRLDGGGEGALFSVKGRQIGPGYIALAFFPDSPIDERHVFIAPSYFAPSLGFDLVGVLRHELGHVLGFRHEHIRLEAPLSPFGVEPDLDRIAPLTPYDLGSVMHYPYSGVGSLSMTITDFDRLGARDLYGPPASEVAYYR